MDETFKVDLVRNVQPTDRKLSVSKESVGPKKRDERSQKRSHQGPEEGEKREKPTKLYGRDISPADDTEQEGSRIDITV